MTFRRRLIEWSVIAIATAALAYFVVYRARERTGAERTLENARQAEQEAREGIERIKAQDEAEQKR